MPHDIAAYNESLTEDRRAICDQLQQVISASLPEATSKIWHGHPVWFIEDNPIVGYASLKQDIQLLFWSGQSFDEPSLTPEGSFKAAEVRYASAEDIDPDVLKLWLEKARTIQWDYKNIVKRRGTLERLN